MMISDGFSKFFSICIPTYNRGHRALKLVKKLARTECIMQRDDIEIVVSDNGSTSYRSEYAEIEAMAGKNLQYNRFENNMNFYGNFNQVVKMSRGQWCLLISDEDSIDGSVLASLLDVLRNMSQYGVVKTATSKHYAGFSTTGDISSAAGFDAIKSYFLLGNYISGTIYNRKFVTDELVNGLCAIYEGNEGYFHYPHLFVEGFTLSISDFYFYDKCLINEGSAENNQRAAKTISSLPEWSSWESRVGQLEGYLRLIRDMQFNDETTNLMFITAVWRTVNLINIVRGSYLDKGFEWGEVCSAVGSAILDRVSKCQIPFIEDNMSKYLQISAEFIKNVLIRPA